MLSYAIDTVDRVDYVHSRASQTGSAVSNIGVQYSIGGSVPEPLFQVASSKRKAIIKTITAVAAMALREGSSEFNSKTGIDLVVARGLRRDPLVHRARQCDRQT